MHCFVFCNRLRGWLDPWALLMLSKCSPIELCPRPLSYHLKPIKSIPFHSECIRPSFVFLFVEVSCCQYSGILPHDNQCMCFLCLQSYDLACSVPKSLSSNSQGSGLLFANRVPVAQLGTEDAPKMRNGDGMVSTALPKRA